MTLQCFTWIAHLLTQSIDLFSHSLKKGVVRDLPDDVVVDILSRLPAECVLTCRNVCRRWRSLTSTEYFIKLHLSRASSAIFVHYWDNVFRRRRELGFYVYEPTFMKRKKMRKLRLKPEFKMTNDFSERVIGSCDGLLLFTNLEDERYGHVFNPITQKHIPIVFPSLGYVCGFFRHPLSNEYKVLFYECYNGCRQYFVYTLRSSIWRKIDHPPFHYALTNGRTAPPACCNGALHWISRWNLFRGRASPPCACTILVFDMHKEDFHTLPHPGNECNNGERHETIHLSAANEQLSFYYLNKDEKFIDIWILEDYLTWGWVQKWKLNLNLAERPYELASGSIFHVELLMIHNRQLWLDCIEKGLFLYLLDQNTVRRLEALPLTEKGLTHHRCIPFTKSLVSLRKISFCNIKG